MTAFRILSLDNNITNCGLARYLMGCPANLGCHICRRSCAFCFTSSSAQHYKYVLGYRTTLLSRRVAIIDIKSLSMVIQATPCPAMGLGSPLVDSNSVCAGQSM